MILNVADLSFRYNSHPVLQDVGCTASPGEIVAILGPNGAGKTTLLRCLNAMLRPRTGTIMLGEQDILSLSRREIAQSMAYVPQHIEPPKVTAFDAILLGRRPWIGWDMRRDDVLKVQSIIDQLGLANLAMRHVDAMSGGELQKVAIARALVQEPRVLLLDEPTSSLDLKNQHGIMQFIRSIVRIHRLTALMTMHDLNLALHYADKFVLVKEGRVFGAGGEEIITPEMIEEVYGIPVTIERLCGRHVVVPRSEQTDELQGDLIPSRQVTSM
ncbi:MAG TPA: ABC transporter ATP-binding protein [Methanoregula sp.]|nr:ABC transporter ATP-binding protein [Methanoregula sp.]